MFETAFLFIVYAIISNIPLILPAIIGAALCKTRGAAWAWYAVGVILRLAGIIGILVGMQRTPELYRTPENIFSIIAGVGIAAYYFWLIRKKNDSCV